VIFVEHFSLPRDEALSPLELFAGAEASAESERFFMALPGPDRREIAALGEVAAIETSGSSRFSEASRELRRLLASCRGAAAERALLVGGASFAAERSAEAVASSTWSAFPELRFVLPEFLIEACGDEVWGTRVSRDGADAGSASLRKLSEVAGRGRAALASSSPGAELRARATHLPSLYRNLVARALDEIAAGELEKVVLARSVELSGRRAMSCAQLLRSLLDLQQDSATFAVGRAADTFLGSTPERLVALSARQVASAALAGSARRGRNPAEDAALGRALVESKKEQEEHAIVVRAIRAALEECCDAVHAPESPSLRPLEGIQHLETEFVARLRGGEATLLDLAGRLHPTPAVGGSPGPASLDFIRAHEAIDRGWYAGPVGFIDARGGGELRVALRSALLRPEEAHLFAGSGIVAGSDPDAELRETRLKLAALLTPLMEL